MYNVKIKTIYSGNPASFTAQSGDSIGSLTAAITPVQSGSGDPSPSNVRPITGWTGANVYRTGKNFLPIITETVTENGITATPRSDGGIALSGTASAITYIDLYTNFDSTRFAGYLVSGFSTTYGANLYFRISSANDRTGLQNITQNGVAITDNGIGLRFAIRIAGNYQIPEGTILYPMLRAADTSDTFEPYNGTTYTVNWQSTAGTVYAGSYDAVSGKLKARPQYASYNGETLVGPWLSSMDVYDPNGTPTTGAQVVDMGGAETVYTLTPQTVTALVGQNYVWSDLGSTVSVSVLSDSVAFHTLAIADSPKTRCRIYFIGDGVDCTDDDDVQTNGTLLVGAVGDTDSNGRIGQDGIKFTEYYNPEYNVTIGRAVSSQIEMTLLNTDGALDNFQYGRCKVYLDVYDTVNSAWLTCPMGVFIIELPTKRKTQLIHATGFDQMQKLDEIADSWWSGISWVGGITMPQIINMMATQVGISISPNTASSILNSAVTYTTVPFNCVEMTYREVLETIAGGTGTVARFDRNGALELRWFGEAQIGGSTVQINTDTIGNPCLGIDLAEYQVEAIDSLKVKIAEDDVGVTVGSGTNQYTILDNLFLDGTPATITARATPIYNRLNGLGAYKPIQSKMIMDWSIESGDIIEIVRDGTTYTVPIFQQTMRWRGGYVVSEVVNSGDAVRPAPAHNERSTYRMQSEIRAKGCSAILPNVGWFRVLTYTGYNDPAALGASGFIIKLNITRTWGHDTNETHSISLFAAYNNVKFVDETSVSNTFLIDKIRYNYKSNEGYVDIHYNAGTSNPVIVKFDVTAPSQNDFAANSLEYVADSPAGENVLVEYSFSANYPVKWIHVGTLAASSSVSFTYSTCATVKAARASSSTTFVDAIADTWNGVSYSSRNDSFATVTAASGTVTLNNVSAGVMNYIIETF